MAINLYEYLIKHLRYAYRDRDYGSKKALQRLRNPRLKLSVLADRLKTYEHH